MELTYYDTRPKDEAVLEKRRNKEKTEHTISRGNSSNNDDVGQRRLGPREVKRRPLPTDPFMSTPVERPSPPEQVHSAPLPQTYQDDPAYDSQQQYSDHWGPDSHYHSQTNTESLPHPDEQSMDQFNYEIPQSNDEYPQPLATSQTEIVYQDPSSYQILGRRGTHPDSDSFSFHSAQSSLPVTPAHPSNHNSFPAELHHSSQSSDQPPNRSSPNQVSTTYGSSPPSFIHDRYAPGSSDLQNPPHFRRYSTSPVKNDVFRDSPLRQSISQHDIEPPYQPQHDISDDEELPPRPPAHRSHLHSSATPPDAHQDMQPVQIPQPLNISSSNRRMSPFDRSPLQSIERNYAPEHLSLTKPYSPSTEMEPTYSPYSKPIYSPAAPGARGNSYDRPISGIENTPPSLRSGYGRGMEETEDAWMQNKSLVHTASPVHAATPQNQNMRMIENGYTPYRSPQVEDEEQTFTPDPSLVKPRAVSPDLRSVPKRKAVTPQPISQGEQRLTSVPFGPDSYEIFNPSSPLSSSVTGPETRYETPEQAKEVARQHEVQKLRDQGPIIGNDGRVIDPSDHLPTDTWAPEPERKNRKPEVVIRYKTKEPTTRTPHRYGSSPGSIRPHSIAGPVYGSSPIAPKESPNNLMPQLNGRNRLQKSIPGRPLPVQPYQQTYSSPAVPSANYNTPSPRSSYGSRPNLSEYALYGQSNERSSRHDGQGSPYGGAPPIPAKVPISPTRSNEIPTGYGGMDALSAELSTIDIGAGAGGRGGRSRRGYGF
jgi:hypothetical protein